MARIVKQGCIIGVKPGMLEKYMELHDNQPEEIRDLLRRHGFLKCEIFVKEIAGQTYLFQYNEVDEAMDNAALYENPVYQEWLRVTGECQQPLPGETFWQSLPQVYALLKSEKGDD